MKDQKSLKEFLELCHAAPSVKVLEELFELFFTPEELEQMKGRHEIVQALLQGKLTQREIMDKFHVSVTQVTRGSNALKSIPSTLKAYLLRWRRSA